MKSLALAAVISLVCYSVLGCQSKPGRPAVTTICELKANPDSSVGKTVSFSGTYKTDSHHYEFLIDYSCGDKRNAIDVGRNKSSPGTASVLKTWQSECAKNGQAALCVIQKDVSVVGRIRKAAIGLVVDLESIEESPAP